MKESAKKRATVQCNYCWNVTSKKTGTVSAELLEMKIFLTPQLYEACVTSIVSKQLISKYDVFSKPTKHMHPQT